MDKVLLDQKDIFSYIDAEIKKDRISHAYFIETLNCDKESVDIIITEILKKLICSNKKNNNNCNCNICNLIEKKIYSDIKYISSNGSSIKKEQLLNLKEELRNKSSFNNKQIYVITDATKLNSSSANTMLKFLEEPEENIIAILVADNRYKVLETILSRCQILSLKYKQEKNVEPEILELSKLICNANENFINYDNILSIIPDRLSALTKLKSVEILLFESMKKENFLQMSTKKIVSIISILEVILQQLEYNVNYKLILDNLLISVWEVCNEKN